MLLSDFCSLMFGLGWYRWHFVGPIYFVWTILRTPSLEAKDSRSFLTDQILFVDFIYRLTVSTYFLSKPMCSHFNGEAEASVFALSTYWLIRFYFIPKKSWNALFLVFLKCVIEFSLRALIISRHNVIFKIIIFRVQ